jgi:CRP-like cAMP-binding protein
MKNNRRYIPLDDFEEVLHVLDDISLFGGLSSEQIRKIYKYLLCISYKSGEVVFKQGDTSAEIYIIRSGSMKIVANMDSEPLELVEYGVGQCFGESSAIGILPHSASAVAISDLCLLVLPNEALHKISKVDCVLFGRLILNIAREVCRRLHNADETILHFAEVKGHRKAMNN